MPVEIEAKLKVDSLEPVRQRLESLGAMPAGDVLQRDFYFDNAACGLQQADSSLRLRCHRQNGVEKIVLSFKGPKQGGKFKRRQELQVMVDDLDKTIELLEKLGYSRQLVIEKKRQLWMLNDCEVSLDELPLLGCFVEIEGPSEELIESVQNQLGLGGIEHTKKGYASLIRAWCKQAGSNEREFIF